MQFTACYKKVKNGHIGKLLEWPGVVTQGDNLEDCRESLIDTATEMAFAYDDDGLEIPHPELIIEMLSIPFDDESFLESHEGYHDVFTKNGRYLTIKQDEEFDIEAVNEICREAGIPPISEEDNT